MTNDGGIIQLKLRVLSQPVEHTLVLGARPCSLGIRCVPHFPFLGFLPAPVDGWCDITDLFVKRYGVLAEGKAIFIRIVQRDAVSRYVLSGMRPSPSAEVLASCGAW